MDAEDRLVELEAREIERELLRHIEEGPEAGRFLERMFLVIGLFIRLIRALKAKPEANAPVSHESSFSWLAILTPKRIWNEDVGDAIETLNVMERSGCSRLKIRAKIVSTYFWVLIAVIRELVAALTGRKSPNG